MNTCGPLWPMHKVFVSGSRRINELPEAAKTSLDKIMALGFTILVGDCYICPPGYGVDLLVQRYLKSEGYQRVQVDHIGAQPRHNVGFEGVSVEGKCQTDKDKAMAEMADYGLAIWEGVSPGTAANIERVKKTKVIYI